MNAQPPPPDRETLARATLTFCLDGADALMYALVKGAGSPSLALELIMEARSAADNPSAAVAARGTALNQLDRTFALGLARWGRRVNARGMGVFHRSLVGWMTRLDALPTPDWPSLAEWFTMGGRQWIIAPHTPYWPDQLQDLSTRSDWAAPLCLWGMGDADALTGCDQPLAVVGSRGATGYGCDMAREIALRAAADGHLIVSGGAMGVDAAAHWGALGAGHGGGTAGAGRTVAVFAGGLNHIGPRSNRRLFDTIVDRGGALVSELCPGTIPEGRRFLLRNRIIAALSSRIVVAQARLRSGALNTAGWGCDLNRVVIAVPGDIDQPYNAGCNRIIADAKAILLTTPDEIADLMHPPHRPHDGDMRTAKGDGEGTTGGTENADGETPPRGAAHDRADGDLKAVREPRRHDGPAPDVPDPGASDPENPDPADSDPAWATVVSAIRSCARRRLPAVPDMLLARCNAPDPSRPMTPPRLLALLGDMESAGVLRIDDGVAAIIPKRERRERERRTEPGAGDSGTGTSGTVGHDGLSPSPRLSANAVSDPNPEAESA